MPLPISLRKIPFLVLLLAFSNITHAIPLVFEFVGTISNTVLTGGKYFSSASTHPQWEGESISGQVIFSDLPASAASPYNTPYYVEYGGTVDQAPYANWVSFIINNPDGSVLDISDSDPSPVELWGEMDSALTSISTSHFDVYRQYQNLFGYPRKSAYIGLIAGAENSGLLATSLDFYSTIIKPEFATYENSGTIFYHTEDGVGYEYTFKIDSFSRVTSTVPEPSTLLLFTMGIFLTGLRMSHARI